MKREDSVSHRGSRLVAEKQNPESRVEKHPHPRHRRGLSRDEAGEADNQLRETRHPNSALDKDPHLHPLP
jgi:hypothetical protein